MKSISRVQLLVTPRTVAYQAPPPMGCSRQEYWSGLPLPSLFWLLDLFKKKKKKKNYVILNNWIVVIYYSSNRKLIWEFTFQMRVIDYKQISISQQVHLWRDVWNSKWSLIYAFCFCNSACYLHDCIDHIVSGKWKLTTLLETEAYLTHPCPCSCNYSAPEILLNHACPCKGQAFPHPLLTVVSVHAQPLV